ncbi:hypothetical protein TYRP_007551 [Tyrophagus putrescentiae]|nr:hypothetical protein TYRP_007551 [Tyrophagus putrescentiae]
MDCMMSGCWIMPVCNVAIDAHERMEFCGPADLLLAQERLRVQDCPVLRAGREKGNCGNVLLSPR